MQLFLLVIKLILIVYRHMTIHFYHHTCLGTACIFTGKLLLVPSFCYVLHLIYWGIGEGAQNYEVKEFCRVVYKTVINATTQTASGTIRYSLNGSKYSLRLANILTSTNSFTGNR